MILLCLLTQGLSGPIGAQGAEGKLGPMVRPAILVHLLHQNQNHVSDDALVSAGSGRRGR